MRKACMLIHERIHVNLRPYRCVDKHKLIDYDMLTVVAIKYFYFLLTVADTVNEALFITLITDDTSFVTLQILLLRRKVDLIIIVICVLFYCHVKSKFPDFTIINTFFYFIKLY